MNYQSIIVESKKYLDNQEINNLLIEESIITNLEDIDVSLIKNIQRSEGKISIGIKELEGIISWAYKKSSKLKITIINDGHSLTHEAQNSLLKVIEEPGENALVIIITPNINLLLDTIQSRCRIYRIQSNDTAGKSRGEEFLQVDFLKRQAIIEKIIKNKNTKFEIEVLITSVLEELTDPTKDYKKRIDLKHMVELLENLYLANQSNVNPKLILSSLNNNLLIYKVV